MTPETIVAIAAGSVIAVFVGFLAYKKLPKRPKKQKYVARWRELQSLCKDKSTWRDAVIAADKLLDRALKQRKFKGKTPGERLVSAQKKFSKNDQVWDAHNLYKKLIANEERQPGEEETKKALANFRQALRDLGALPSEK
ncbi:MAG: hypothetical protein U5L95_03470 [Candidatus Saccharibacteria bacterium]|nr:hypothetical protein [Candidatus Saccharibacteria bacterium]